ncbi:SpoIIE family protein phosphatase [Dyella acidisoli]|uniref:IcfG protein n=1 Tax=Dyella acidisoli TaxID=1867834 RepID=A0ABQ5XU13_9GAMM|nr:SpoIIE family protein phosphatase [Dyella acidisoli]GLQ94966.1 IcfG protein [Dyella acidisoli]
MVLRSLASRLAVWVLSGATVVFVASGFLLFRMVGHRLLEQTHRESEALASQGSSLIQERMDKVTNTARVLAAIIGPRPGDAESLIRDAMAENADLAGLAAAFVPNTPAVKSAGQSPFVSRQYDGSLERRDLLKDPLPYWEAPWFKKGVACDRGCWQAPFLSQSRHRQLVSYSSVMQVDGKVIGVVNADVTLDWLQSVLLSMDVPAGTHVFVVDWEGMYLANDTPGLVGKKADSPLLGTLRANVTSDGWSSLHLQDQQGDVWVYSQPIRGTDWNLALVVPNELIYAQVQRAFLSVLVTGAFTLLLLALLTMMIIRRLLTPLGMLAEGAELVARGALDFALPKVHRSDEIGRLTRAFDKMRQELAAHLVELTRIAREQQRLSSELEIAQQIQTDLLPGPHYLDARCQNFELFAALKPARIVGGDLYSYFMLPGQRFCVIIGDVADKGIPAALFMARTITLAKAMSTRAQSPQHLLQLLNRELCKNNENCMFVTLLCGFLDAVSGNMAMASAGHDPPVRWGQNVPPQWLPLASGPALGLDEDALYPIHRVRMRPGDTLLMYTDGVTEATDAALIPYGGERIIARIGQYHEGGDGDPVKFLVDDIEHYSAEHGQSDDIALVALRWNHVGLEEGASMLELVFPAALHEVFDTLGRCEETLRVASVPHDLRTDVRLVLEELMVNMVQHGRSQEREDTIGLRLTVVEEAILVELNHDGEPFDPLQSGSPSLTGDIADKEEIGGLGIHLVRAMASELIYTYDEYGNHLQLRFACSYLPEHDHGL